jgi:hypothetical protein
VAAAPAGPVALPASALRYVTMPRLVYPAAARRLGETGTALVRVVVDVNGLPREVTLHQSSGHPAWTRPRSTPCAPPASSPTASRAGPSRRWPSPRWPSSCVSPPRFRPPEPQLSPEPAMDTTTASVVTPPPAPGIGHFIAQSDAVGHTLLVLLVGMSIASWAIIVAKGVAQALRARRSRAFLDQFWNASTLDEVRAELQTHGARDPSRTCRPMPCMPRPTTPAMARPSWPRPAAPASSSPAPSRRCWTRRPPAWRPA